jgi:hypothetical protein
MSPILHYAGFFSWTIVAARFQTWRLICQCESWRKRRLFCGVSKGSVNAGIHCAPAASKPISVRW